MNMTAAMEARTNKPLTACTDQEIYLALLDIVREQSAARVRPVTGRKLYYISAEFLIGKLLYNNLINLGLYDDTRAALAAAGKNLSDIEEVEPEPSLGNGGLGRLAACFLDSLATLNLPGDGDHPARPRHCRDGHGAVPSAQEHLQEQRAPCAAV